jgi:hypothetical protein
MSTIEERLLAKAVDATPGRDFSVVKAHETCRAPFNHDWVEYESTTNPAGGGWYLTMRCSKCATVFKQVVNYDGSLHSGRKYKYAAEYKDRDKWSRTDWRRNYLLRLR